MKKKIVAALTVLFLASGCEPVREAIHDATAPERSATGSHDTVGEPSSTGPSASAPSSGLQPGRAPEAGLIRTVAGGTGPAFGILPTQCGDLTDGGPIHGPDCVTQEIHCGETIVGHTRGGVNRYDTNFYERNQCWPGTRNHRGGDERVYLFVPDKSPRFQAGESRQRVSVYFDSPCADLTFSSMLGSPGACPTSTRQCDTSNPFTRKMGRSRMNLTVDQGETYYFLVEGADDAEGAFAITVECGT